MYIHGYENANNMHTWSWIWVSNDFVLVLRPFHGNACQKMQKLYSFCSFDKHFNMSYRCVELIAVVESFHLDLGTRPGTTDSW